MSIQQVTDADFTSVVEQSVRPVLVEFGAPWCGPCAQLEPIIRELAAAYSDRLTVVSVDTSDNPITAIDCQVQSLPTIQFYRDGRRVKQMVGSQTKKTLLDAIEEVIS